MASRIELAFVNTLAGCYFALTCLEPFIGFCFRTRAPADGAVICIELVVVCEGARGRVHIEHWGTGW